MKPKPTQPQESEKERTLARFGWHAGDVVVKPPPKAKPAPKDTRNA